MRKSVSMRCMIASDAACIIGGFIAAVLVVQLVQSANHPSFVDNLREFLQPSLTAPGATVNRAGKSDRPALLPFDERFGREFWIVRPDGTSSSPDDPAGRMRFWIEPGGNTTIVPKGLVISGKPANASTAPAQDLPGERKPQPSPIKTIGCDPLASPLVEPDLARFSGRCLTQLVPAGTIDAIGS